LQQNRPKQKTMSRAGTPGETDRDPRRFVSPKDLAADIHRWRH